MVTPIANVSVLTEGVKVLFGKLIAAGLIVAIIYISILLYAKSKKVSKTTLQFVDIAARLIGAFSFLSILYYITTPTSNAVIQSQSESISTDEYSLWPITLTIIAVAIITAILTFKKSVISRIFKKTTYQTPAPQANTEQKSNKFSIKTIFSKGNSELNLELLRKIEWRRFEHVCETIFKELG